MLQGGIGARRAGVTHPMIEDADSFFHRAGSSSSWEPYTPQQSKLIARAIDAAGDRGGKFRLPGPGATARPDPKGNSSIFEIRWGDKAVSKKHKERKYDIIQVNLENENVREVCRGSPLLKIAGPITIAETRDTLPMGVGIPTDDTSAHFVPMGMPVASRQNSALDEPPKSYSCPITCELMADPVSCADGHTYERAAITAWLKANDTSPVTNTTLPHIFLTPNHALRGAIDEWLDSHPDHSRPELPPSSVETEGQLCFLAQVL